MILRLWLLVVLTLVSAFAPSRACARGAETRTGVFWSAATNTRPDSAAQTAGTHQSFAVFGYELASGYAQAAESEISLTSRIRNVGQRGFDYAVENPRTAGLNRMQLGKDAEVQATRWMRRWAERNGVEGIEFQVRGANSVPDVVFRPGQQIFDFKLTPRAVRPVQTLNFQNDFPGFDIDYIFGPGPWRH